MSDHPKQSGTGMVDTCWEDLVLSILSVRRYSLEQTYADSERLQEAGLFNPHNLISWDARDIAHRMKAVGFDRGQFMTDLFAQRLAALGDFIRANGITKCEGMLHSRDKKSISDFWISVKGIGPTVLENFFLLRNIK